MASFEFLAIIISVLGLAASITYYATILNNANKTQQQQLETRQAQLYLTFHETRRSKDFQKQWYKMAFKDNWEDFDDYMAKYGPDNDFDSYTEHGSIYQFYDGIGFLLKKGIIDLSYIDDNLQHSIILIWDKYESIIKEYRKRINRRHLWKHFEYLSNELKKI